MWAPPWQRPYWRLSSTWPTPSSSFTLSPCQQCTTSMHCKTPMRCKKPSPYNATIFSAMHALQPAYICNTNGNSTFQCIQSGVIKHSLYNICKVLLTPLWYNWGIRVLYQSNVGELIMEHLLEWKGLLLENSLLCQCLDVFTTEKYNIPCLCLIVQILVTLLSASWMGEYGWSVRLPPLSWQKLWSYTWPQLVSVPN